MINEQSYFEQFVGDHKEEDQSIAALKLTTRTHNSLMRNLRDWGEKQPCLDDLLRAFLKGDSYLLAFRNFGPSALQEVKAALKERGYDIDTREF